MFAFTLESLVLRGVVRTGELAVSRLGFGATATRSPEDANSVLPPARTGPDTDPLNPDVGYPTKGFSPRAGRSCRHAGSSIRQEIATASKLWRQTGGTASAAAAITGALPARLVASVVEVSPRLAVLMRLGTQGRSR
jgi:hypothetical protein